MPRSKEGYVWTPTGDEEGLLTEAVVPSTTNIKSSYDVVVVGAGFAGLIAARNICQQGNLKVLVVEGRDRIGGRTWTAKALGEEFEMGGTWVSLCAFRGGWTILMRPGTLEPASCVQRIASLWPSQEFEDLGGRHGTRADLLSASE